MDQSTVTYFAAIYLAFGLAKMIIMLADLHIVTATVHRVTGRPAWQLALSFIVATIPIALLGWPKALLREGWHFFFTYSRFTVMRQILMVYRAAGHNLPETMA